MPVDDDYDLDSKLMVSIMWTRLFFLQKKVILDYANDHYACMWSTKCEKQNTKRTTNERQREKKLVTQVRKKKPRMTQIKLKIAIDV